MTLKQLFKRNTHNAFFKALAGFGRSLNRLYENRNHDIYSNGELTVLKKIAKLNPAVIIDGGANIGGYSLVAHKAAPNAAVYSFEPVLSTFELLKEKTKEVSNIHPVAKGLYSENCSKEINIFPSNTHSSLVDIQGLSYETTEKQTIELVKGDDFMQELGINEIDLLKIDVEGVEFDVLQGFEQYLKKGQIKAIQFEYGYINITTKKLLLDYHNYFEEQGYLLGKIFPKSVEFREYKFKYEDFIGPNFLAVHKSQKELIQLLSNNRYQFK